MTTASNAPSYFVLQSKHDDHTMMLRPLQPIEGVNWMSGQRFAGAVPRPLHARIVGGYEKNTVPPVYAPAVPMMRNDLLASFRRFGVDNIDAYPLVVRNKVTGEEIEGFSAINIIGLVSAADPSATEYSVDNPSRLIDADIDRLTIDPARTGGALLFRLAEAVTGVVVHERVKNAIEATGAFPNLLFVRPEEWMG